MVNYKNAKIYKLTNSVDQKIYYGSTCLSLKKRLSGHKTHCRRGLNSLLYRHMRIIGPSNFNISLVKNFPCENKDELIKEEDIFIQEILNTEYSLNKNRTGIFVEKNKKKYHRDYYKKRRKFWICECGSYVEQANYDNHLKTRLHHNKLNNIFKDLLLV